MTDQNRKTLRSFYCLDALWSSFEAQTHEYGVSMDYLLNEAMRQFAEVQGFWAQGFAGQTAPAQPMVPNARPARNTTGFNRPPTGQLPSSTAMGGPAAVPPSTVSPTGATNVAPAPTQGAPMGPPMQRAPYNGVPQGPPGSQIPPQMGNHGTSQFGNAMQNYGSSQVGAGLQNHGNSQMGNAQSGFGSNFQNFDPPPPPPRAAGDGYSSMQPASWSPGQRPAGFGAQMQAPPQPPRPQQMQGQGQGTPLLYLYFDNNRYTIGTEDFVIGRGSQRTDLTIRDGNISRRHCAILHRNGSHYIKDLGSTNGVEFQGNRIESKKISEGDVYYLCDYELRFSYR